MLNLKQLVAPTTPVTLKSFVELFDRYMSNQPDRIAHSQQQKSIIADTLIFYLSNNLKGNDQLPFSYGTAYLAVGIPKEFITT